MAKEETPEGKLLRWLNTRAREICSRLRQAQREGENPEEIVASALREAVSKGARLQTLRVEAEVAAQLEAEIEKAHADRNVGAKR